MISEYEKQTIVSLANRYRVKKILLFGSSASLEREGEDIDLAVEGIQARDFFRFYGDLLFGLKRSVDLIDLILRNRHFDVLPRPSSTAFSC